MKKVKDCIVDNCIPTPTSCSKWNGGEIKFLGICDGDDLNNVVIEIVDKIEEIVGEDLSSFDIDSILTICNQTAPLEVNLLSILNVLKNNDICLKDFIDTLNERIEQISATQGVNVNLKCFADFDNLGNALSLTRDGFDQLLVDTACNHKQRIESLESGQVSLQNQIDNIDLTPDVDEPVVATCVNPGVLAISTQIQNTSTAHCDLETATGDAADINSALSQTPLTDGATYGLIPGWIAVPASWAENYNNLLLKVANMDTRLKFLEDNCCAASCKDIELGFTAIFNEDNDGVIIKFTSGAGTDIPAGFTDSGSTITITDIDGNTSEGVIDIVENFNDNLEYELSVSGLNLTGDLSVDITAKIGNEAITCEKCLHKLVKSTNCGFCTISATGGDGSSAVIVYEDGSGSVAVVTVTPPTTTSTTTTTTTGL